MPKLPERIAVVPLEINRLRELLLVVNRDVVAVTHDRRMFRELMQMIEANPRLPRSSVVYEWLVHVYVERATAGVRRLVDHRSDVVSFVRLLRELREVAHVVTRTWFVAHYEDLLDGARLGDRDFDAFAPGGAAALDPGLVAVDLDLLTTRGEIVKEWVNKYVAHRDEEIALGKTDSPPRLRWGELDAAIDLLADLLRRYELLLNQRGMGTVEPVIQEDWEEVFRVPWIMEPTDDDKGDRGST